MNTDAATLRCDTRGGSLLSYDALRRTVKRFPAGKALFKLFL